MAASVVHNTGLINAGYYFTRAYIQVLNSVDVKRFYGPKLTSERLSAEGVSSPLRKLPDVLNFPFDLAF